MPYLEPEFTPSGKSAKAKTAKNIFTGPYRIDDDLEPEFTPSGKSAKAGSAEEITGVSYRTDDAESAEGIAGVSYRIDDESYTYSKSNKSAKGGEGLFDQNEERVVSSTSESDERMHTFAPNNSAQPIDESFGYRQSDKSGEEIDESYYQDEEDFFLSMSEGEKMHIVVPNNAAKFFHVQLMLLVMSLCFILNV